MWTWSKQEGKLYIIFFTFIFRLVLHFVINASRTNSVFNENGTNIVPPLIHAIGSASVAALINRTVGFQYFQALPVYFWFGKNGKCQQSKGVAHGCRT